MTDQSKCPECGAPLPADAPMGMCPRCLFNQSTALTQDEDPAAAPEGGVPQAVLEGIGSRIDRYTLLEKLGEGGCGVVYMAEQTEPVQRRVALKVIKLGLDSREMIARFEAERQALALMDHPNIARVFDAGCTASGRPYFVMELVHGVSITQFCDERQLDTRQRLQLFIEVCSAVQHAHQKGIIHRDLKPSNVLVSIQGDRPVPKVIDFGIAKATYAPLTSKTVSTALYQFIGTPAYMSPEQATASGADIDTRSDVYSLGVLLYELLTGKTPFEARSLLQAGVDEIRRIIREEDPPTPSTRLSSLNDKERTTLARQRQADPRRLGLLIRGDLDWMVMKALEKDRRRRYDTASGFARDIRRYLDDEPVIAAPPSAAYRAQKFFRRNRIVVCFVAALAGALIAGAAISIWQAIRAIRAERDARAEAAQKTQITRFLQNMLESVNPDKAKGRDISVLREVLDQAAENVAVELASQPAAAAEVARTIGRTYAALGEHAQAELIQRKALSILTNAGWERTAGAALALSELGMTLQQLGREGEATNLLARAIDLANGKEAGEGIKAATPMVELAFVYEELGNSAAAELLMTNAIAKLRRSVGSKAPETLMAVSRLAAVQFREGRYSEADATASSVIDDLRNVLGPDALETMRALYLTAIARQSLGNFPEAERLQKECMERRARILGPQHPSTLASMDDLGIIYSYEGKFAEAEQVSRKAVDAHARKLGPNHRDSLGMKSNLAEYIRNQNRFTEAEPMFKEVIAAQEALFPADQPFRVETQNSLAVLYCFAERYPEAEKLSRSVLAARLPHQGEDPVHLADAYAQLNVALLHEQKYTEAEKYARLCLPLRETNQPGAWDTAAANGQLGLSLEGQGRFTEAEPLLAKAYQDLKPREAAMPAIEKVRIAEVLDGLVRVYEKNGKTTQAAPLKPELTQRLAAAKAHNQISSGP